MMNLYVSPQGEQWLSDGFAIFPLIDCPAIELNELCSMYDISSSKQEKMFLKKSKELPAEFDFRDAIENELAVEVMPLKISINGFTGIPLKTSCGVEFIASQHLTPFSSTENMLIYERLSESGRRYFALKIGFLLVGIVMPVNIINDSLIDSLNELSEQCCISLENQKRKIADESANDEQEKIKDI